ncbi:acyltransferase family protein [uncultured Microbacterium sp.]|uniref:acyltransferase family protein n=1 Tax=uncultured Microbacterium sp. TaxID=191216 RepID=UPI003747D9A3
MTTVTSGLRLDRLTSLRFFAALLVFAFHSTAFFESQARDVLEGFFGAGRSGVTFFFVLSGFMLAWVHRQSDTPRRFYLRRLARIYPAYLAALAFAATLWAITDPSQLYRGVLAPFLLQAWVPDATYYFGLNVVAWSLSVEAFFYVTFPLFARFLAPRSTSFLWSAAGIAVACTIALATIANASVDADGLAANSFTVWLAYYCPVSRLPEFVFGMILGFLCRRGQLPAINWWAAIAFALAAYALASVYLNAYSVVALVMVPFAILIVAAAQRDLANVRGLLTSAIAVELGALSYCFYLMHHIFIIRLAQPGIRELGIDGAVALGIAFSLSMLGAWLLHKYVEVPMERRLSGR